MVALLQKSDLHGYQDRLVTELYERSHILAIVPMGGGKTVSALTAFAELQRDGVVRKGIVLAPKFVAGHVWPDEIKHWAHLQGVKISIVMGTPIQRQNALDRDADLYVMNIENTVWLTTVMRTWDTDDPRLDLLIVDEMSRYKAPKGKRSRALSMVAENFKNRWGLTGTPRPNSELDLYQPARILCRWDVWDLPFDEWRMMYFMPDDPYTQFNWFIRDEWRDKIWNDVGQFTVVVKQEDLPPQPELTPVEHWVDLPEDALEAFNQMLKDHVTPDDLERWIVAENAGVASGKLDQIAQGFIYDKGEVARRLHDAKLACLRELVAGLGGQQAMITYWYKEDLERIRHAFHNIAVIGSVTDEKRAAQHIDAWNAGEIDLLALHPASAGHGLNLQKSHAGQIIHYCPTWSAELFDQVNLRIARQGNKQVQVFNHLILARGTFDEIKVARVRSKMEGQQAFIDFMGARR